MFLLAKYNTQTTFVFPVVKRAVVDLAVSADWTPATGDTKVSKDGGNVANTTNNPAAVGGTGSALWSLTLTATELSAAEVVVQIVDSATKAIEDQVLRIYTFGNSGAKIPFDFSDTVRAGLTGIANAAAGASGGLLISGSNSGTTTLGALTVTGATTLTGALSANNASNDVALGATERGLVRDKVAERTTLRGTVGSASTTTSIVTSAMSPATTAADQLKGRIVVFDHNTTTAALRGQATDITASSASSTPTLTVTALTTAPASTDTFTIV